MRWPSGHCHLLCRGPNERRRNRICEGEEKIVGRPANACPHAQRFSWGVESLGKGLPDACVCVTATTRVRISVWPRRSNTLCAIRTCFHFFSVAFFWFQFYVWISNKISNVIVIWKKKEVNFNASVFVVRKSKKENHSPAAATGSL